MKDKTKSLLLGWVAHYLIVLTVINLAFIINTDAPHRYSPWEYFIRHTFYDADSLVLIFSLLFMELNYQFLFQKLRLPLFALSCLLVGALSVLTLYYLNLDRFENKNIPLYLSFYVAGYTVVYAIIRNYIYKFSQEKNIQIQQSKIELDALKAQLNPHFLFNGLNYLYGTALTEQAPHTADGIDKLSEMMRFVITGIHENFVPLDIELKFIRQYLELQQARLPEKENIKINIQLPSSSPTLQIAPLLLLPFIENAFRYGISMDEPCFINLKIDLVDTNLVMEISNSIISKPIEITGNNTGIKNTIKRMELLYPDNYKLRQTNNDNEYKTLLNLKLKP